MPFWDVRTPIRESGRCDNPEEVREQIAEYMATEGARINNVTVIHVPQIGNIGTEVSQQVFWQPDDE
jgi:hypothetical protein